MSSTLTDDHRDDIKSVFQAPAPTEVKGVVGRLTDLQAVMEQFGGRPNNPVASFNGLYTTITQEVEARLAVNGFQDPDFMIALDLRFAERYFRALQDWSDRSTWAPRCWSALFNKWNDDDMAPILGAIAGVTAHIRFDLGAALVRAFKDIQGSVVAATPEQIADYKVLNEIFAQEIPQLRRGMLEGNLLAGLFDKVTWNWDDLAQAETVTVARQWAWERAESLWPVRDDPDLYADQLVSLDGSTESLISTMFRLFDNWLGNYVLGSRSSGFWGTED
ncbi:DUF5995 family protein [Nakamurella sp.]|uniref:DUF5995 family protein n=1 Tax=Nakamurella sp. TaxID=1869182 RepID=UPI0037846B90